jgi:hypothetical protein
LIDAPAQFLGALSGGLSGPAGERTDGVAALPAIEAVVDEERLAAAQVGSDAKSGSLGIVIPPHHGAGQVRDELVRQPHRLLFRLLVPHCGFSPSAKRQRRQILRHAA